MKGRGVDGKENRAERTVLWECTSKKAPGKVAKAEVLIG